MDGVQRNFSMMAEKIDRMRCLRERCDNYVRLIKLTLDETIKEQNSLLDGSAIHNRLKYLGVMDKPKSLSNTFKTDNYHYNIDFNNKYKYLVFDDDLGFRQHKKKPNLNTNDMYLSNNYSNYNTNYKPRVHDFSTVYDDQDNTYYMPINSKKYGKTMSFRSPDTQEYQVYYFPTSKPIAQYPRHTTERFYRRKPVKQYPKEEVPYWPTRYPKPVRVVERDPSFSMIDYGYRSSNNYRFGRSNIEPYTPDHHTRYYPTNDSSIYHGHDDSDYYYEPHLGQRSFSSITRPCSPVYNRDILCDRPQLENSSSLLEKKIRDYVWNPHQERIEKYMTPSYEKPTYYTDFKPSKIKHQADETFRTRTSLGLDFRAHNRKNEVNKESAYKKNSILTSPDRRSADDEHFQSHKDNDHYSESTLYKKKTETPSTVPKRISFDLGSEHIDLPNHSNSIEENINDNCITKDHKLVLGRKESNAKLDDKRRTSLLPKDDYSVSISKQRVSPSNTNVSSRRQSLSKQEKLASIGNSFESDKYLNLKNNFQGNELSLSDKSVRSYNNDRINYDNNNDIQIYQDDKNNVKLKDVSNENTHRDFRRDSNDKNKNKFMETTENPNLGYQDHTDNTINIKDNFNVIDRRESYKGDQKLKKENTHSSTISSNGVDNKLKNESNNKNGIHVSPKNRISSPVGNDINNMNNYNMSEYEPDHLQQFTSKNDTVEKPNNFETIQPYNVVNDSNNEIDITNTVARVSSDFKTISEDQDPLHEILNNELAKSTDYYQDHPDNDDIKEHPTHGYETQPDHVTDEHFYTDELVDSNKEIITNNNIEPIQQNEFDDKNNVHDDYYYQNPTDDKKENLIENQYENPDSQVKDVEKQHANDDYYYQNYSNVDQQEQPENQYSKPGVKGEYTGENVEHVEHDDYYYQNHPRDDLKEQQGDQQYVDPNYQGNYVDQTPAHDDYYYQNYSNDVDPKVQPENQYTESDHQGEYVADQMVHDDYYYQNHPKEGTNENQINQHYQEHQGNYANGEQDNYYYENNSNVNVERHPDDQYDENAQQETYTGDQHANDGYYYQEGNTNYEETAPKEQYDGYVDNNHDANAAYYPDSNVNNYDQQQNDYENNSYTTQKAEYIEPYEQNSNNENNGYSENIDESQPTSQIANEQK